MLLLLTVTPPKSVFARYRDGRLLNAERTGKFDGDFEKLWRLLSR